MSNQKPGKLKYIFSGFFVCIVLLLFFLPVWNRFVVENADTGKIYYLYRGVGVLEFSVSYIHSVNKSRITDFFSFDEKGGVVLVSSRFSSFGAGVASYPEENSSFFSNKKNYIDYEGINRPIDNLVIFVGTEAKHSLEVSPDNKSILLEELAPVQTRLGFSMRKISTVSLCVYYFKKIIGR